MRVLIYGAGAVGQATGCMLAADGHTVDMILRKRFADVIREHGLTVSGIFGEYRMEPRAIGTFTSLADCSNSQYDVVFITTKSYDTQKAADDISSLSDVSPVIVSLQNGCGNLELLVECFGPDRVLGGRVITGFEIERPGHVRITVTADAVHIGGPDEGVMSPLAERIAAAVDHAGLPCAATDSIRRDLFAKLLYNCALNPLGAVLGVHYGALGENPFSRGIMNAVIDEVFAVISALGAATHWETADEYREFFYSRQVPATYDHRPSMLQDIESGKRTEVDSLTGYVVREGKRLGVPTHVCDTLSNLIRFREGTSGSS